MKKQTRQNITNRHYEQVM